MFCCTFLLCSQCCLYLIITPCELVSSKRLLAKLLILLSVQQLNKAWHYWCKLTVAEECQWFLYLELTYQGRMVELLMHSQVEQSAGPGRLESRYAGYDLYFMPLWSWTTSFNVCLTHFLSVSSRMFCSPHKDV